MTAVRFVGVKSAVAAVAAAWCATAAAQVAPAVLEAERERIASVVKAEPSVVAVFGANAQGGGSGVLISKDGYALSNYHVTRSAGTAMKCGLSDGQLYDAVIVGIDMTGDVALIKLFGRDDFPAADVGDSDTVRAGDWVFAMGNPFLLATDYRPTVTYGIVSGTRRYQYPAGTLLEYADCIQTDASINPGNSGGPLFDARGRLVGINGRGSFEKRGRVNVGVGYAISINQIKNFLGALRGGLLVDHATLGAVVGTDLDGKVRVTDIIESSDAYRRGLRYNDELQTFGGRRIETVNGFKNALGVFPKDWRVPLEFRRDQERLTPAERFSTYVRLAGVHRSGELQKLDGGEEGPKPGAPRERKFPAPKKPGDKEEKEDKEEKDGKDDGKKEGKILPHQAGDKQEAWPKVVKEHFEARTGFANYYFNRREQERVAKLVAGRTGGSSTAKVWNLAGLDDQSRGVKFLLTPTAVRFEYIGGKAELTVSDDLTKDLAPLGSGGFPTALHLWHKLLTEGPAGFSDVRYAGTFPIPGSTALADCLTAVQGKAEIRFYVDPADGRIVLLEMYPDSDSDPCEVHFSDYAEVEGAFLPRRWEIRHADAVFAVLQIQSCRRTAE